MKKYSLYIITIPLAIASLALFVWLNAKNVEKKDSVDTATVSDNQGIPVERYGVARGYSSSGDARFNYYDIERKEILDSQEGYRWFWALPENQEDIDNYYKYIRDNSDAVFKIKGTKWEDDCDYYADGSCLEQVMVEKIEAVIDIKKTIVECKNGDKYTGEFLIEKGINFQLTPGGIFIYKGEELQKLCDPTVKEYDYDIEPNYQIIPTYL